MSRRLALFGMAICLAVGAAAGAAAVRFGPVHRGEGLGNAVFRVQTTKKLVALTFDDGPDERWTPAVLDLLQHRRARATFFLIGRNAIQNKALVARELAAGDEIGNHTWDHPDLETLRPAQVQKEIADGADAIEKSGAPTPRLFRPPKGLTDEVVGVVADADRFRTIFWDLTLEHFVNHAATVADGVDELLSLVRPGDIILAHDGGIPNRGRTIQALPLLLEGLHRRGYNAVSVSELLRAGHGVNHR